MKNNLLQGKLEQEDYIFWCKMCANLQAGVCTSSTSWHWLQWCTLHTNCTGLQCRKCLQASKEFTEHELWGTICSGLLFARSLFTLCTGLLFAREGFNVHTLHWFLCKRGSLTLFTLCISLLFAKGFTVQQETRHWQLACRLCQTKLHFRCLIWRFASSSSL